VGVRTGDPTKNKGCLESAAQQKIGDPDWTGDQTSLQTRHRRITAQSKTSPVSGTPLADNPIGNSSPLWICSERVQQRRCAIILCCGILFVVGLGFALVMTAELPTPNQMATSVQVASAAMPHNYLGSAKVTIDSADGSGCRQRVLDNQTWRMTQSQQPCGTTDRDSNGIPRPMGTIHRLDAISKSFLGK
jgi:hypothetical protein